MTLSYEKSKIYALSLMLLAICLIVGFVVFPIIAANNKLDDKIAAVKSQITQYRNIVSERKKYENLLGELKREDLMAGKLIVAESDTMGSASLQNMIKKAVTSTGGEWISARFMNTNGGETNIRKLQILARARLNIEQLQRVLYTLESQRPNLLIDQLTIESRNRRRVENRKTILDVRFRVVGFMQSSLS